MVVQFVVEALFLSIRFALLHTPIRLGNLFWLFIFSFILVALPLPFSLSPHSLSISITIQLDSVLLHRAWAFVSIWLAHIMLCIYRPNSETPQPNRMWMVFHYSRSTLHIFDYPYCMFSATNNVSIWYGSYRFYILNILGL